MMMRRLIGAASAIALAGAGLALGAGSAQGATPTTGAKTLQCQTRTFSPYDWALEVSMTAVTDGTDTVLTATTNKLPGVVPVNVTPNENGYGDTANGGFMTVEVDGTSYELTGLLENVTIAANQPVDVPTALSAKIPGALTELDVAITKVHFDTYYFTAAGTRIDFHTYCPPTEAAKIPDWTFGKVAVEQNGTLPTVVPVPSNTSKPTQSTSKSPDKKPGKTTGKASAAKGKAASGTAKFSCVLQEIGSDFDYNPKVTVSGARASEGDSKVSLRAQFSNIPGLAPVPIENGSMKITATIEVDGKPVNFSGSSSVNVDMYEEVPVPVLESSVDTDAESAEVKVTAFKFDFGQMQGMDFYSDCKGGGTLSKMTIGVGSLDNVDGGAGAGGTSGGAALPKTGGGAPFAMIGLWSSALVLLAAALFLLLPARRSEA